MAEEKSVLLKIELDTSALKSLGKDAEQNIPAVKKRIEELKEAGKQNTIEYARAQAELKQYNKQLKDSSEAMLIFENLQGKTNLTTIEQQQAQKALSVAYNNLTEEQKNNTEEGKRIAAQYKEVNDTLNKNALAVNNGRYNVGLYEQSIKRAYAEIGKLSKEITQIGYVQQDNKKKLDESTNALNKLTSAGDTTSAEYVALSKDVAYYTEAVEMNNSVLKEAETELTYQQEALQDVEKEARKIGFVYGENTEQTKSYKEQLKELKYELIQIAEEQGADSEAFIEGTRRAGELADKIKDVNERVAAQTSGSGFEKLSNTFGLLVDDLKNADFEGVAEKAKAFENVSRNITLKEMIAGLKGAGQALLSLAKAILANPLFLFAAVIAAVTYAVVELTSSSEDLEAQNDSLTASYERQIGVMDLLNDRQNRNNAYYIRLAELEGKSAEEIKNMRLKAIDDEQQQNEDRIKAITEQQSRIRQLYSKAVNDENVELQKSLDDQSRALQTEFEKRLFDRDAFYQRAIIVDTEFYVEQRKQQEEEAKKQADAAKRIAEQRARDIADARKRIRDLITEQDALDANLAIEALEAELNFEKKATELAVENEFERTKRILSLEENFLTEYTALLDAATEAQKEALENRAADEIAALKGSKEQIAQQRKLIEENLVLELDAIDRKAKDNLAVREQNLAELRADYVKAGNAEIAKLNEQKVQQAENALKEEQLNLEQIGAKELDMYRELYDEQVELAKAKNRLIQEDDSKTLEEKRAAELEYRATIAELDKQLIEGKKEKNDLELEQQKQIASGLIQAALELTSIISDIQQRALDQRLERLDATQEAEKEKLQQQLDDNLISQEKYNELLKASESKYQAEAAKLKKEAFKKKKAADIVSATINTAVAVTTALTAGPIVGVVLAALTAALGAVQIGYIASQPEPAFAGGGLTVLSGKRIGPGDGKPIRRNNGDNLLASVKTNEVILNEAQQAALGGDATFAAIGVPGFAGGGVVASGLAANISSVRSIENQVAQEQNVIEAIKAMPPSRVIVQDIAEGLDNAISVQDAADI